MAHDRAIPTSEDRRRSVADLAAEDAGGLSTELLGDFLEVLTSAVSEGRTLSRRQLRTLRTHGDTAARQGVALRALLDLYLSSAWRLWRELPAIVDADRDPQAVVTAGEVMLHAVDDAVAELAEGFQLARRVLMRAEESARREFVDDLLSGSADIAGVMGRAETFGLDLTGPHAVVVVAASTPFTDGGRVITEVERAVEGSKADSEVLVASKEGRLVVVFAAPDHAAVEYVVDRVREATERVDVSGTWTRRIGVGRTGPSVAGVVSSYREAVDSLDLGAKLGLGTVVVDARDLLVYRVLLDDKAAITDLVHTVLTPLLSARGGAGPLLDTLFAFFGTGGNSASTARAMHLSVRAVTYRLARVAELTGHDVGDPAERFTLQTAVYGARLLGWPTGS
ncbi:MULTISPECIES: PucR family transcriptional regulator [Nocardiaceae]|uniref:PucR family transcriptional regulator n=1 Tax=Nocardiaceae TaxID=85025 RepID=UPI0005652C9D|nr:MULTISPECIES: helix-turn-helix domain-containing protein [Rhodococcus]OZF06260.1 CdaR family transcriptional regulator [Rhodococcus sp. 15-1189-1-1a]OZF21027.1 CdaR family transcriptional regulator [Rhodococcus sp. 14-2686-1-2]OZF57527.1 CdaR family transcriptional regulator [Rhodococcus sp. 14-2470-1b]